MNKTTFPKIIDKGDISSAVTFSAQLKFSLLPDDDGSVTVANVACGFKITQFDCKVLTGANKSLFKMLIGVFKAKLTETVGELVALSRSSWLPLRASSESSRELTGKRDQQHRARKPNSMGISYNSLQLFILRMSSTESMLRLCPILQRQILRERSASHCQSYAKR